MAQTISAKAASLDFVIEQGADFNQQMTRYEVDSKTVFEDLTGWTARLTVRKANNSPATLLELTTENGGIALAGAQQFNMVLTISDTDTAAIEWDRGIYNMYLTNLSGYVERILTGTLTVDKGT